jgi:hypothetical protein
MGVHHSVIDRLMQRLQATGMVDEHLRSDCPRRTTINCVCLCIVVPNTNITELRTILQRESQNS